MSSIPILLDSDANTIAVVDDFVSFNWKRALTNTSTFEMVIPSTSAIAPIIAEGMLILSPDNPPIAYLAEQISVTIEGRAGEMSITGRALDGAFGKPGRIVLPPPGDSHDTYDGVAAETVMKTLVSKNAGPDADVARQLPDLIIATDQARGGLITVHGRYQPLLDLLEEISVSQELGWEVYFDTALRSHVFEVISGNDVSDTVIYDVRLDAATAIEWLRTQADYASFVYVAGSGEGAARLIEERWIGGLEPTGLSRKEVFLDGKDVSDTAALQQIGDAHLAKLSKQTSFKIDINADGPYRYRTDWDLGDFVRVFDRIWGIDTTAQIVSVASKINSTSLAPTRAVEVGKPLPSQNKRIRDAITEINTRE